MNYSPKPPGEHIKNRKSGRHLFINSYDAFGSTDNKQMLTISA